MPVITRKLLRKRAEHNEGVISTLEEVSLHQEELEGINDVLGATCRKLKILYLQNNIISKMENLNHFKDLQYLNLALNNITKIEGLQNCEFLNKLDLTVNFIDLDVLRESITHLQGCQGLRELYMMGNPCDANWPSFSSYVIARLPQLHSLDGKEITKSIRILALQKLPELERELEVLAIKVTQEKQEKKLKSQSTEAPLQSVGANVVPGEEDVIECGDANPQTDTEKGLEDREKLTDHSPETRNEIYLELAQQKCEKEERERANMPRERDDAKEHEESKSAIRKREESLPESEIKQKNEGQWGFRWDESDPAQVILEVDVSKHLDSSLIDVDVHPTYVSIIIKCKLLRLHLPAEVKVSESKCQRSKVNGSLKVVMPKVNPRDRFGGVYIQGKASQGNGTGRSKGPGGRGGRGEEGRTRILRSEKAVSVQEQMLLDAARAASSAVSAPAPAAATGATTSATLTSDFKARSLDYRSIVPTPQPVNSPLKPSPSLSAAGDVQKNDPSSVSLISEIVGDGRAGKNALLFPVQPQPSGLLEERENDIRNID